MEKRLSPSRVRFISILLAGGLAAGAAAWAEEAPLPGAIAEQEASRQRRLGEAEVLQDKGMAQKEEAKKIFEARKKECFHKFRVTDCQHKAKQEYVQATNEARRIENEGKALERQVKKEELAEKEARRIAEEPARQADLKIREAEVRAERQRSEERRDAKLAEKEEKAEIGAERRAADEERLRQKREKHERRVAEKAAKAKRHQEEATASH